MTNGDVIRNLTNKQLAVLIADNFKSCDCCSYLKTDEHGDTYCGFDGPEEAECCHDGRMIWIDEEAKIDHTIK